MASIKISDLTSTETLTRDDVIPVVNGDETKKISISNLSKNLAAFGEIGFAPLVVDTLPTEDIKTNTIYLTPSEDPDETNTYDEWIYSNETWEKIGTTGNTGSPTVYTLELDGSYNPMNNYNFTTDDKSRTAELITGLKDNANVPIYVRFKGNGYAMLFTPFYGISSGQQTSYSYQYVKFNDTNVRELWLISLYINGSWSDNTFSVTSSAFIHTDKTGFLSTSTSIYGINDGFTPTTDYHPATKKYVDDSILTAITDALGGEY